MKNSILFPVSSCNQQITPEIIEQIELLYEDPSLPDFKFEEIEASKRGFFLDFEVTVINAGLADATNTTISVFAGDKEVVEYDVGALEVGLGRIVSAKNVRVFGSFDEISFVVDAEDAISEISERNNRQVLVVQA